MPERMPLGGKHEAVSRPVKEAAEQPIVRLAAEEDFEYEIDLSELEQQMRTKQALLDRLPRLLPRSLMQRMRHAFLGATVLVSSLSGVPKPPPPETAREVEELILASFEGERAEKGEPSPEQMLRELEAAYGHEYLIPIAMAEYEAGEERESHEALPSLDGELEQYDVRLSHVRGFIRDGLPSFMGRSHDVSRVDFSPEPLEMNEEYNLEEDEHAAGSCTVTPGHEPSVVEIYPDAFGVDLEDPFAGEDAARPSRRIEALHFVYRDLLIHEFAHAVDWRNASDVDAEVRTRLLYHMTRAVQHEDAMLQFGYAERISNPDQREELRHRVTEYYADLLPAVLNEYSNSWERFDGVEGALDSTTFNLINSYGSPAARDLPRLAEREQWTSEQERLFLEIRSSVEAIVEFIRAADPDFNFDEAQLARERALVAAERAYARTRVLSRLDALPESPMREAFRSYVESALADTPVSHEQRVRTISGFFERLNVFHRRPDSPLIGRATELGWDLIHERQSRRDASIATLSSEEDREEYYAWLHAVMSVDEASGFVGARGVDGLDEAMDRLERTVRARERPGDALQVGVERMIGMVSGSSLPEGLMRRIDQLDADIRTEVGR